jgi:ABC-type Zn uptake system ZnuABC Zn-binding protein ZnuA
VVATTTIIGDIAQHVAGDKIEVVTLLKPGVDPHEYDPVPSDLQAVAGAKVVFANGAGLETWLPKLMASAGSQIKVQNVSAGLPLRTLDEGGVTVDDPHLWFDVQNAIHYTEQIRDELIAIDPSNAEAYRSNADDYIGQLQDLDTWVNQQVNSLSIDQRLLVTNHDTFGYFAQRYSFKVLGTVFPTGGAEASPSAQQIAALVDTIKRSGVKAVFTENTLNPDLANTVAQEAGVKVIDELYTDSLGPAGSPAATYIDLMHFDVQTIVAALK